MTGYLLLPQNQYNSQNEGFPFQMGGRKKWKFILRVSQFVGSGSGSVTVDIEVSPRGTEDTWRTLVSFGAKTETGVFKKESGIITGTPDANTPEFIVVPYQESYIRARISAIRGSPIVDVRCEAPFFDVSDPEHQDLVSKELRTWGDGFQRMVEQSEEEIIDDLMEEIYYGILDADLTIPGCTEAIRREIALQADHNRRREALGRANSSGELKSLREMTRGVPGRSQRLRKYRKANSAWLGR